MFHDKSAKFLPTMLNMFQAAETFKPLRVLAKVHVFGYKLISPHRNWSIFVLQKVVVDYTQTKKKKTYRSPYSFTRNKKYIGNSRHFVCARRQITLSAR